MPIIKVFIRCLNHHDGKREKKVRKMSVKPLIVPANPLLSAHRMPSEANKKERQLKTPRSRDGEFPITPRT